LRDGRAVERGFSKTDLGFGAAADFGPTQPNHLSPLIIVDHDLGRRLKALRLRGVTLKPIGT
jgi:hypothetical protein